MRKSLQAADVHMHAAEQGGTPGGQSYWHAALRHDMVQVVMMFGPKLSKEHQLSRGTYPYVPYDLW